MKTLIRLLKSVGAAILLLSAMLAAIGGVLWAFSFLSEMEKVAVVMCLIAALVIAIFSVLFYATVFEGEKP